MRTIEENIAALSEAIDAADEVAAKKAALQLVESFLLNVARIADALSKAAAEPQRP